LHPKFQLNFFTYLKPFSAYIFVFLNYQSSCYDIFSSVSMHTRKFLVPSWHSYTENDILDPKYPLKKLKYKESDPWKVWNQPQSFKQRCELNKATEDKKTQRDGFSTNGPHHYIKS